MPLFQNLLRQFLRVLSGVSAGRPLEGPFRWLRTRLQIEPLEVRVMPTALPDGFQESRVASGFSGPTAETFAPNGRLFVLEKGKVPAGSMDGIAYGYVRVVNNGTLLTTPFLTLAVNAYGEALAPRLRTEDRNRFRGE